MFYRAALGFKAACLPSCCFLCDALCRPDSDQALSGLLCPGCLQDLQRNRSACYRCAEPVTPQDREGHTALCASCQQQPPEFDRTLAPYLYGYPLDQLIRTFKQRDHPVLAQLLARLMLQSLKKEAITMPDLILPVPTHWRTRLRRGFNPAAVLATLIGRELKIPVLTHALGKSVYTEAQHTLNRQQRRRNLKQSFVLHKEAAVKGLHLALVDDVVTTGSTAGVIAALLRDNGAASVQVWALARTPPKRMQ